MENVSFQTTRIFKETTWIFKELSIRESESGIASCQHSPVTGNQHTHTSTGTISMDQSPSSEAIFVKTFSAIDGIQNFTTLFETAHHWTLSRAR
jgi:hypothetical protein